MTARTFTVMLASVLALAGCASAADDQPSQQTTTTITATEPTTSASRQPECADVAQDARALVTEVGKLATRDATVGDVTAAADSLSESFEAARATLGPDAQADLAQAGQALQRVKDALGAQPVDIAGLRRASADLFAALGDAAAVCSGNSSSTGTPTGSSATETGTTS